uniref:Protein male-specific lethal-1 dimerisation domain-containing protein n=1 Tax=Chelonoidis abingdonii TaxID=106734 RepID=A0A8C0FZ63_CHEAB
APRICPQEESWGGLVPLPCPPASTKPAGVGDASSRPKYQAVLPGHTASQVVVKDKGCLVMASALPPTPPGSATVEPGQPPPAMASESKWKRSVWKSPLGAGRGSLNQAACLMQILLLQLDLIEQQQQQLQAKEKEIEELKAERDTLLARIECMERRMPLVKKDNEREKHRIFQGYETEEKAESEASEKLQIECQQDLLDTSQPLPPKHFSYGRNGRGHKRKSAFGSAERKTPSKTLKHSPVKEEPSSSLSETVCKRELRSQETPEKARSLVDTPLKPSTPLKSLSAHPRDKSFPSETEDLPYLSTTETYLCRWHQPPPSPLPLREPSPKKKKTVAIPSKAGSSDPFCSLPKLHQLLWPLHFIRGLVRVGKPKNRPALRPLPSVSPQGWCLCVGSVCGACHLCKADVCFLGKTCSSETLQMGPAGRVRPSLSLCHLETLW